LLGFGIHDFNSASGRMDVRRLRALGRIWLNLDGVTIARIERESSWRSYDARNKIDHMIDILTFPRCFLICFRV
jgi:hypothetical protein